MGVADGLGDAGDVVVVVEVDGDGAGLSFLLHDATNDAMATRAAPPTSAATRAEAEGEFMGILTESGELASPGALDRPECLFERWIFPGNHRHGNRWCFLGAARR